MDKLSFVDLYWISEMYIDLCFISYREAADKVSQKGGKFEELVVCAQEIAGSTAQLVVASKVKADRTSKHLPPLGEASKQVTECTGRVVASAKSAAQMIEDASKCNLKQVLLYQKKDISDIYCELSSFSKRL